MKEISREKLIAALRCGYSVHKEDEELACDHCPYLMIEEIPDTYRGLQDFEADGKLFVKNCDIDRMAQDAANMLEADGEAK
jgi:hypothetical protein